MHSGRGAQGAERRGTARWGRFISRALRPALCALLLASCGIPVLDEVTIEPSKDSDTILVTAWTKFELRPANEHIRARVDAARAAALSNTDAWSMRFSRLDPEEEQVAYAKSRGALERVTRSARIRSDELQQLFSDANITVDVLRGEGWRELTFYPGTSGRATREQRQRFDEALAAWSDSVAHYFVAVDHLYSYLDERPQRDRYVLAAVLDEENAAVTEDEQPLVDAVRRAMEEIAGRMDQEETRADTFAEEADLVFNPFPARITVRPPGDVLASEGFTSQKGALTIEPVDLFGAIAALEGQWISPDPLAALLRDEQPTAIELAKQPRHSRPIVSSTEVAKAIRDQLTRPRTYRVRWRE